MLSGELYGSLRSHLTSQGLVPPEALDRADRAMAISGDCLGDVLTRLGLLSEAELVAASSHVLALEPCTSPDFPPEKLRIPAVTEEFLTASRVLPLRVSSTGIEIAVANPFDEFPKKAIEYATNVPVTYRVASPSELQLAIEHLYPLSDEDRLGSSPDSNIDSSDADRLADLASEAPVIRYVNRLLHQSVVMRASDIHIEPFENGLNVRLRNDGLLTDAEPPSSQVRNAVVSRIKIMSNLNIAESRLPQDGRLRLAVRGRSVDFRVSTTPTMHGESVVLRILDRDHRNFALTEMGLEEKSLQRLLSILRVPTGIVLVTGPTGSGKTTTLYAALRLLNQPTRKILAIEDPIEYSLPRIVQVQTNEQLGLSFAAALRSFLRQDPDIMMVGEIRDRETASIAAQAALTGHLILSTLHTNSAAAAVTRLLDIGIESYLIASTLSAVVAQRLLRILCGTCKRTAFGVASPVGCDECRYTGYSERTIVAEVLSVTESVQRLVRAGAAESEIENQAKQEGMTSMLDHARTLVQRKITSPEELHRVLGRE